MPETNAGNLKTNDRGENLGPAWGKAANFSFPGPSPKTTLLGSFEKDFPPYSTGYLKPLSYPSPLISPGSQFK
jgi:hypothetical protein